MSGEISISRQLQGEANGFPFVCCMFGSQFMTEGRSIRYAIAFAFVGISAIAYGLMFGQFGVPLIWLGASFLCISANYANPRRFAVLRKRDGRVGYVRKCLLLPYFLLLHGAWHLLRLISKEPPYAKVVDGIFIGRRLLPSEFPQISTLVDLTAEFDEHLPQGANLFAFPILDGAPAEPASLRRMAREIATSAKPIYIHCAQGHGRTSMVSAAVLIELGAAKDVTSALEMIRAVRPDAKPNTAQREALVAAFEDQKAE